MKVHVLIVGAAPEVVPVPLLNTLADEADMVIAADGGADFLRDAGVRPDVLVGDLDSIDSSVVEVLVTEGVEVQHVSPEKDFTDLELGIAAARARGATRITLTGVTGGRLDHTLATVGSLARACDLRPEIVGAGTQVWILGDGGRTEITVRGPGTPVSVVALCGDATVSLVGMRWPLDAATLRPLDGFGISNRVTSDDGTVKVHSGTIAVMVTSGFGSYARESD